jgi:molybdopterin-containing oxidoreductase family membrane subunit
VSSLTYSGINDDILTPHERPSTAWFIAVAVLGVGATWAVFSWMYQVRMGMGVTGLSHPVGWATYITSFVFWVGIAHSGTLISAILHLVRSRWRVAIARSSEAMTVFAVMTAGLFPLIHLGRIWVAYYIIPYPSERQLWPDFLSPLVGDVCAISTYFAVSSIFWYVGLLPDLAAARDRWAAEHGVRSLRARVYRLLALGWSFSGRQWRKRGGRSSPRGRRRFTRSCSGIGAPQDSARWVS